MILVPESSLCIPLSSSLLSFSSPSYPRHGGRQRCDQTGEKDTWLSLRVELHAHHLSPCKRGNDGDAARIAGVSRCGATGTVGVPQGLIRPLWRLHQITALYGGGWYREYHRPPPRRTSLRNTAGAHGASAYDRRKTASRIRSSRALTLGCCLGQILSCLGRERTLPTSVPLSPCTTLLRDCHQSLP